MCCILLSNQTKNSKEKVQGNLLHDTPSRKHTKVQTPIQFYEYVSNVKSSQFGAILYIFEDNEAVIKMIIKGRCPRLRHVSRTHRVALDWLFDRINLDPQTHIVYVDSKNQLAEILTKGNFTRDEWNHLLHLFNISIFTSASCLETMAKLMQEEKGEERIVAKSMPTLNLVSHTAASSSTARSSSASNRLGMLRAPSQQGSNLIAKSAGKPAAGGSNQNDAASSSQVWLPIAKTDDSARKLLTAGTNLDLSFQDCARELAAENSEINDENDSKWPHNYRISRADVPHHEKVYSNLRQHLKRNPEDKMEDLDVNTLMW